jgi:Holliday junction resolvase RusA-like endonuclease
MNPLVIEFGGDPVGKGRPRMSIGAHGRPVVYTPAKTRKYEAALRYAADAAMAGRLRFLGPVAVAVTARLPVPRSWPKKKQAEALAGRLWPLSRPDADNFLKSAIDALNGVVVNDDAQFVRMTVEKRYSLRPGLRIEVTPLSDGGLTCDPK